VRRAAAPCQRTHGTEAEFERWLGEGAAGMAEVPGGAEEAGAERAAAAADAACDGEGKGTAAAVTTAAAFGGAVVGCAASAVAPGELCRSAAAGAATCCAGGAGAKALGDMTSMPPACFTYKNSASALRVRYQDVVLTTSTGVSRGAPVAFATAAVASGTAGSAPAPRSACWSGKKSWHGIGAGAATAAAAAAARRWA